MRALMLLSQTFSEPVLVIITSARFTMKRLAITLLCAFSFVSVDSIAQGTDRDLDNDGQWDYGRGGTDRDLDNDRQWDHERGGTDRDTDNDGVWDFE